MESDAETVLIRVFKAIPQQKAAIPTAEGSKSGGVPSTPADPAERKRYQRASTPTQLETHLHISEKELLQSRTVLSTDDM
jgi:hypothetical protein